MRAVGLMKESKTGNMLMGSALTGRSLARVSLASSKASTGTRDRALGCLRVTRSHGCRHGPGSGNQLGLGALL